MQADEGVRSGYIRVRVCVMPGAGLLDNASRYFLSHLLPLEPPEGGSETSSFLWLRVACAHLPITHRPLASHSFTMHPNAASPRVLRMS